MEYAKCFGGVLAALTKQKATVFSAALMAIQYARNDSSSGYLFGVLEFLVTPRVRIPPLLRQPVSDFRRLSEHADDGAACRTEFRLQLAIGQQSTTDTSIRRIAELNEHMRDFRRAW
jgi:hypothetical protein